MAMSESLICYLCGQPIDMSLKGDLDEYSEDHIPPQDICPKELREAISRVYKFQKLPAHKGCNNSFSEDETYFVRVMTMIVGNKSMAGDALVNDFARHAKHPEHAGVLRRILGGYSKVMPSGIWLPPGKGITKIEYEKVHRVIWKIVRGLYFQIFKNKILPEGVERKITRYDPGTELPKELLEIEKRITTAGMHKEVFVYKYGYQEPPEPQIHIVIMLFWKAVRFITIFHNPDCRCEYCTSKEERRRGLDNSNI